MTPDVIAGHRSSGILIIADHSSNRVPGGVELGIDPALLETHIAFDIGTGALARGLSQRLQTPAILGAVTRLVVDCNRCPDDPACIPDISDGVCIAGNAGLAGAERAARIAAYHEPYHALISATLARGDTRLLVSLHSFTPSLAAQPEERRPWPVALLSNRDRRAADIAIAALAARGLNVGDNQPYSGSRYGYSTDRHAEANAIAYLTFEVRQDTLVADLSGWTGMLATVISNVYSRLISEKMDTKP